LTDKWKQVAAVPRQSKLDRARGEDLEAHRTELEAADKMLTALRLLGEAVDNLALQSQAAARDVESRLLEKERKEEAKKRASSLMRPMTKEELKIVRNAMYGIGPGDEVLARAGSDFVQRSSIQTLQPGQWLNDEVIHHFYLMLSKRDEAMCQQDSSRKRSHFFKSFFFTKLLNEGHSNPDMDGKYEYRNVRRWSKKVPGKDIFNLDKVFFPINEGRMHWICGVADITHKRIHIYDSMGSDGTMYLESILRYLQDEHQDKKGTPLPDIDQWELLMCESDTPRQRNGEY
jgi:sentrin-specific protease 1